MPIYIAHYCTYMYIIIFIIRYTYDNNNNITPSSGVFSLFIFRRRIIIYYIRIICIIYIYILQVARREIWYRALLICRCIRIYVCYVCVRVCIGMYIYDHRPYNKQRGGKKKSNKIHSREPGAERLCNIMYRYVGNRSKKTFIGTNRPTRTAFFFNTHTHTFTRFAIFSPSASPAPLPGESFAFYCTLALAFEPATAFVYRYTHLWLYNLMCNVRLQQTN
jgi:hypothetical protein